MADTDSKSEWRSIKSAPKRDPEYPSRGPLIWLGGPGWVEEGWWGIDKRWVYDHNGEVRPMRRHPTHWQPFVTPSPPGGE